MQKVAAILFGVALFGSGPGTANAQLCTEAFNHKQSGDLTLFLSEPTNNNADALLTDMSTCSPDEVSAPEDLLLPGHGRDYPKLLALANAGNVGAIKIMFGMTSMFDAEPGETLSTDLGNVSDVKPYEFLVAYDATKGISRGLRNTLLGLGPDYVDDLSAQIQKLKRRYEALKAVKNAPSGAKEECLRVISEGIKKRQEIQRESESQSQSSG